MIVERPAVVTLKPGNSTGLSRAISHVNGLVCICDQNSFSQRGLLPTTDAVTIPPRATNENSGSLTFLQSTPSVTPSSGTTMAAETLPPDTTSNTAHNDPPTENSTRVRRRRSSARVAANAAKKAADKSVSNKTGSKESSPQSNVRRAPVAATKSTPSTKRVMKRVAAKTTTKKVVVPRAPVAKALVADTTNGLSSGPCSTPDDVTATVTLPSTNELDIDLPPIADTESPSLTLSADYKGHLSPRQLREYQRMRQRDRKRHRADENTTTVLQRSVKRIVNKAMELSTYPIVTEELTHLSYPCRASPLSMRELCISDALLTEKITLLRANSKTRALIASLKNTDGEFTSREKLTILFKLNDVFRPEYLVPWAKGPEEKEGLLQPVPVCSTPPFADNTNISAVRRPSRDALPESRVCTRRMRRSRLKLLQPEGASEESSCASADVDSLSGSQLGHSSTISPPSAPQQPVKRGRPRKHALLPVPDGKSDAGHNMGSVLMASLTSNSFFERLISAEVTRTETLIERSSTKAIHRFQNASLTSVATQDRKRATHLEKHLLSCELREAYGKSVTGRAKDYLTNNIRCAIWWKFASWESYAASKGHSAGTIKTSSTGGFPMTTGSVAIDNQDDTSAKSSNDGILTIMSAPLSYATRMELPALPVSNHISWQEDGTLQQRPGTVRSFDEVVEFKIKSIVERTVESWACRGILIAFGTASIPSLPCEKSPAVWNGPIPFVNRGWLMPEMQSLFEFIEEDDPNGLIEILKMAYDSHSHTVEDALFVDARTTHDIVRNVYSKKANDSTMTSDDQVVSDG